MSHESRPRIGVGVFVFNGKNEFLIGRRIGSKGAGTFALPGGHLEFGEAFEECAARETMEETGVQIWEPKFLTATNSVLEGKDKGSHYVTIFITARLQPGDEANVEVMEPEKCVAWEWITWETMKDWAYGPASKKRELFQPLTDLLKQRSDIVPRG